MSNARALIMCVVRQKVGGGNYRNKLTHIELYSSCMSTLRATIVQSHWRPTNFTCQCASSLFFKSNGQMEITNTNKKNTQICIEQMK